MTINPSLLELAKQGDIKAIGVLINRQLHPKGIKVKTSLKHKTLQVTLEASEVPDQEALVSFICKGILKLEAKGIEKIQIHGKKADQDSTAWSSDFTLEEAKQSFMDLDPSPSVLRKDAFRNGLNDVLRQTSNTTAQLVNRAVTSTKMIVESELNRRSELNKDIEEELHSNLDSTNTDVSMRLDEGYAWERDINTDTQPIRPSSNSSRISRVSEGRRLYTKLISTLRAIQRLGYFFIALTGLIALAGIASMPPNPYSSGSEFIAVLGLILIITFACLINYVSTEVLIAAIDLLSRIEKNTRLEY